MTTWIKNANNFQKVKIKHQDVEEANEKHRITEIHAPECKPTQDI